jgi:hypothetical protein
VANAKLDKTLPLPTVDLMNQFKYVKSPPASKTFRTPNATIQIYEPKTIRHPSAIKEDAPSLQQKTPSNLFKERIKATPEQPALQKADSEWMKAGKSGIKFV